jgi:tetratricopeptide (TPR) repeat protein
VAGALPTETKSNASDSCRNAFAKHRGREVLAECRRAFAEDPRSAEIAVLLARTEFDRGRFRPALDWARKALALDESQADAYVFLGGAEQAAGHVAAARTAYKRYLQLSPKGRYASDLRKVLRSL